MTPAERSAALEEAARETVAAWPAVLRIIREYDESFPYAEKEGDDEAVTRMRRAIEALRERIGAMQSTEDQRWCAAKADEAKERGAPTVEAQLRKAAEHPDTATNIRRVMGRASKAASIIKGTKP